jgi:hypothetical protein
MPNIRHPGYIKIQQDQTQQFTPFIRSDIGKKIPGDRPNGFYQQTPIPQHLKKCSELPPYNVYFVPNRF